MMRRIRSIALLGWVLLILLLSGLWMRSYRCADLLVAYTSAGHPQWIASHEGQIIFFSSTLQPGRQPQAIWFREVAPAEAFARVRVLLNADPKQSHSALGFSVTTGDAKRLTIDRGRYTLVAVPHWALIGFALLLVIRPLHRRVRRRRWRRAGLCAHCGYDLRATPGKCPECGATKEGRHSSDSVLSPVV